MRLLALLLALVAGLAGCIPPARAPYDIVQVTGGRLVNCEPTTDWTATEVEQRCGEPAVWVPLFGAEVVQCAIYETRATGSVANRIAVCIAPGELRPVMSRQRGFLGPETNDSDDADDGKPAVTRGNRRVVAIYGLRAD